MGLWLSTVLTAGLLGVAWHVQLAPHHRTMVVRLVLVFSGLGLTFAALGLAAALVRLASVLTGDSIDPSQVDRIAGEAALEALLAGVRVAVLVVTFAGAKALDRALGRPRLPGVQPPPPAPDAVSAGAVSGPYAPPRDERSDARTASPTSTSKPDNSTGSKTNLGQLLGAAEVGLGLILLLGGGRPWLLGPVLGFAGVQLLRNAPSRWTWQFVVAWLIANQAFCLACGS